MRATFETFPYDVLSSNQRRRREAEQHPELLGNGRTIRGEKWEGITSLGILKKLGGR